MLLRPNTWAKPAISVEEQVDRLVEKGLIVRQRQDAASILSHVSYFKFNKYIETIAESANVFSPHTLEEVVQLYHLDRMVRITLLEALLWIEAAFRANLSNIVTTEINDPFWYLDSSNFRNESIFKKTLEEVEGDLIKAWMRKQPQGTRIPSDLEALPAWEMVESVSFGKLSKLFSNLKRVAFIEKVGKKFNLDRFNAKSVLRAFVCLRNDCAHQGKILGSKFSIFPPSNAEMKAYGFDNTRLGGFVFFLARAMKTEPEACNQFLDKISYVKRCTPSQISNDLGLGDIDKIR